MSREAYWHYWPITLQAIPPGFLSNESAAAYNMDVLLTVIVVIVLVGVLEKHLA